MPLDASGGTAPTGLSFSLVSGPTGAAVDASTGRFTWTPDEPQGPGVFPVSVAVRDVAGAEKPRIYLTFLHYAERELAARLQALQAGPLMLDMLRRAYAGGVNVAFGTDTGVSRHGDNAQEFALMVEAGFTPEAAIRAATVVHGADTWDYLLAAYPTAGTIDVRLEGFTIDANGEGKHIPVEDLDAAPAESSVTSMKIP